MRFDNRTQLCLGKYLKYATIPFQHAIDIELIDFKIVFATLFERIMSWFSLRFSTLCTLLPFFSIHLIAKVQNKMLLALLIMMIGKYTRTGHFNTLSTGLH